MSPPWNNGFHSGGRPWNPSSGYPSGPPPGDYQNGGGWGGPVFRGGRGGFPHGGREPAGRGGRFVNSWEPPAPDHQNAGRWPEPGRGGSRVREHSNSWDAVADQFGGLSVTGTPAGGGWGHWPSPNAGAWNNPSAFVENSGWRSWPRRPAAPAPVRVEQEVEQEPDPFGSEVNNGDTAGINFDAYEDIPVEVIGEEVPPPASTFADIDLGDALNSNIKRCKYVKPTPIQRHAIPIAVAGRDLMACAQTGSGKTAAFCFPIVAGILNNGLKDPSESSEGGGGRRDIWQPAFPVALILSPTRELCCQIHEEAKKFAYQTGVRVAVAYGGAPLGNQLHNMEKGVDILVATPGRLIDIIERGNVSLSKIKYLTLDEADRMLDMGFEQQVRKIVQQMGMPEPGVRQTMLFSATFPDEIQKLASEFLSNYVFLTVGRVGSSADLISQRVEFVEDIEKRNHLRNILCSQNAEFGKKALTLVFVQTKKGADSLEKWLCRSGFPAMAIHGDKVQMEREHALKSFKSGATSILVATDVAARGLDIPSVSHVVNFDMPTNIDDYVHRIGRTGRAGKSGVATAFFSDRNTPIAKALLDLMEESKQEVPPWLREHAQRSASYGGGGGGRQRYRGGGGYGGGHGRYSGYDDDLYHQVLPYQPTYPADYASIVPSGWD